MSTISLSIQSDSAVVKPSGLAIGMTAFGGRVGYILKPGDPGFVAGQTKGFAVANPPNIGTNLGADLWAPSNISTFTDNNAIGAGPGNTANIVGTWGSGSNYAARTCTLYTGGGFNDWYLPSRDELVAIMQSSSILGLSGNPFYYSSSQPASAQFILVWVVDTSGVASTIDYRGASYPVTAIRSFTAT